MQVSAAVVPQVERYDADAAIRIQVTQDLDIGVIQPALKSASEQLGFAFFDRLDTEVILYLKGQAGFENL